VKTILDKKIKCYGKQNMDSCRFV